MPNINYYSKYIQSKFKYICLKFNKNNQIGGFNEDSAQQITAAAFAVINCSNQDSIDCNNINEEIKNIEISINKLENELNELNNKLNQVNLKLIERRLINSDIQKNEKLLEILQKDLKNKKDLEKETNINNRICDNILIKVASIYLAIIYHQSNGNIDSLTKYIIDMIHAKLNNCNIDNIKKKMEKQIKIIIYYLNIINTINQNLLDIGETVTFTDIFNSAEYSKEDKDKSNDIIDNLLNKNFDFKYANGESINKEQVKKILNDNTNNYSRIINSFIYLNIQNIKLIPINDILNKIKENYTYYKNSKILINNKEIFDIYISKKYEKNENIIDTNINLKEKFINLILFRNFIDNTQDDVNNYNTITYKDNKTYFNNKLWT